MIELKKNQKIDLAKKDGSKLAHVLVGLGWKEADKAAKPGKGLFGLLSKKSEPAADIDIDASVFLSGGGKIDGMKDVVYFNNRKHASGAVIHHGDNLVGGTMAGMEDSEQIDVDLSKVPERIDMLAFVVNIYDCVARKQDFGMVRDAYIRIVDKDTGEQLARYDLTGDYGDATAIVVGEASRSPSGWSFRAVGEGTADRNISQMMARYGG